MNFELWEEGTQRESHNWLGRTSNRELVVAADVAVAALIACGSRGSDRKKEESAVLVLVPALVDCDWRTNIDADVDVVDADAEVDWEAPVYN